MTRVTDDRLAEIEQRCSEATPGPWSYYECGHHLLGYDLDAVPSGSRGQFERVDDADFIASARTDIPDLVADLREARAEIERLVTQSRATLERHFMPAPEPNTFRSVQEMLADMHRREVEELEKRLAEKDAEIERLRKHLDMNVRNGEPSAPESDGVATTRAGAGRRHSVAGGPWRCCDCGAAPSETAARFFHPGEPMSNALKAAADRVRKYGKFNDELLLATHVLSEFDDTPLTVEHLLGMGFRETPTGAHSLEIGDLCCLSIDPLSGDVWLYDDRDFDLPGTYRTVGALRRLLVGLKGDVP